MKMPVNKIGIVCASLLVLGGCAKLEHLQELLTLKEYSDGQARLEKSITRQNKRFDQLVLAVKENRLEEYPDERSFIKNFGEPILVKEVEKDGMKLQQWLYRYAIQSTAKEKVYVYFDEHQKFVTGEHVVNE